MRVPWWPIVGLIVGLAGVVAFDRFSTREDRWRERLAATAARVRSEDSIAYDALRARFVRDSLRADSLMAAADAEEAEHIRLAQDNGRLRVQLAQARTMPDTVRIQAAVIANQDSIIRSDSTQKGKLRETINGHLATIIDLNTNLADARRRLGELVNDAQNPPKEFKLLGLTLKLKPYLGYGIQVNPATGKADHGVQLGVSVLRG